MCRAAGVFSLSPSARSYSGRSRSILSSARRPALAPPLGCAVPAPPHPGLGRGRAPAGWPVCRSVAQRPPARPATTWRRARALSGRGGTSSSHRSHALALSRSSWPGNLRPSPAARSRPRPRLSAHPRLAQDAASAFHSGGRCPARAAEACCPAESGAARPCVKKKKHEHSYRFRSKPRPAPANATRPGCTPSSLTCHPRHVCCPVRRRARPGRPR